MWNETRSSWARLLLEGAAIVLSILEARYDQLRHTTQEFDALMAATDAILVSIEASLGE